MTLEKVFVKEEMDCENGVGLSEAAARAGLYADHVVKYELVIGPETLQQPSVPSARRASGSTDEMTANIKAELEDQACVKIEPMENKSEPGSFEDQQVTKQTDVLNHKSEDAGDMIAKCSIKLESNLAKMLHTCNICGETFDRMPSLEAHMLSHEAGTDARSIKDYVCDMCKKSFKLKSNLIEHIDKAHCCTTCRKHLRCESRLQTHEHNNMKKHMFSCKICAGIIKANRELLKFVINKEENFYQCKICQQEFTRRDLAYSCNQCKKKFTTKNSLDGHLRTHSGQKPYSCKLCKKKFTVASTLLRHRLVHTVDKPYSCDICHKRFTVKYSLIDHKRLHTGEKLYKCKTCDRAFLNERHLIDHERIHTGDKPYSCNVCRKRFARKGHVSVHMRVHTGQKPYSCEICHKQFRRVSALKVHQRLFKGQEPYTCEICHKTFCLKQVFNKHRRTHDECDSHSDSEQLTFNVNTENMQQCVQKSIGNTYKRIQTGGMFACDICNKQFTKQSSLTQHVQILHSL